MRTVIAIVIVTISVASAAVLTGSSQTSPPTSTVASGTGTGAGTTTVKRGDLSSQEELKAKVSYGKSWPLNMNAQGVVTKSHPKGTVVGFGEELIRIGDKPVFLARGDMPMYRKLNKVDVTKKDKQGKKRKLQTGQDVEQLQRFLLDSGFDSDGALVVDGVFGAITEDAVEDWQEEVGLLVTGAVDTSQIVFSPQALRIDSELRIGAAFNQLQVGAAGAVVIVETTAADRALLPPGGKVDVTMPNCDQSLKGEVKSQQEAKASDGSTIWRSRIATTPAIDPACGAVSATVTATKMFTSDVLNVPVGALLALAEGGYGVEVVNTDGTKTLIGVDVGEIVDGFAEIDGEISEGDEVVTPA